MHERTLRIRAIIPVSRANGPGNRAVIWVQGCTLGCPGCFNPATHDPAAGEEVRVSVLLDLLARLARAGAIDGLSVSGGEPLQQIDALIPLCAGARARDLTVLVWTGFTPDQAAAIPGFDALMEHVDLLIAGPYVAAQRIADGLRGSANKVVLRGRDARLAPDDLADVPSTEVIIDPAGGTVAVTGIRPPRRARRGAQGGGHGAG